LHETDPTLASPRLEVSLYDDAFDPPLTSSSLVAPSSLSTPIGTTISALTLHASPFPLAQCMGLEMGKLPRGDVSVLEDDFPTWLREPT